MYRYIELRTLVGTSREVTDSLDAVAALLTLQAPSAARDAERQH